MPGAVTEPKTSPWKVTAQNVEERIKFKHNRSRIALALRSAKIHRPGLYLSANTTFNCSNSSESAAQLNTTLCNRNSIKTKPSKRANRVNCKQTDDSKNRSETCSSDASGRTVSKLDSRKLRCSRQIATDANEGKKSGNPSEQSGNLAKSKRSEKTVTLKTVNVKPWTNDGVKTARIVKPHLAIDDGDKSTRRNLSRLVSLQQECNDTKGCSSSGRQRTAHRTLSCQADDGTVQHASQDLLKPGRIVCSHAGVPHDGHMDENCLSGILLVTSKIPANPCSFQHLPLTEKVPRIKTKSDFLAFERGPRLCAMKTACHLCEECRKTFQNVSRVHGPDVESEYLTRLKYKLKLKERELLKMESNFDKTLHKGSEKTCSNELAGDEPSKCKLGEKFTLPKLYLTHHSTAISDNQKTRKTGTKMTDSHMTGSEECSNARKQFCYKRAKVERLDSKNSPRDKLTKNSAKISKVQGSFSALLSQTEHLRMPTTPLRGFTPLRSELTESPMLWREAESEVEGIEQETEMAKEDLKG